MKLNQTDLRDLKKGLDPEYFQKNIYPYFPKKKMHKLIAKNCSDDDISTILNDYLKREMTHQFVQFMKILLKLNKVPKQDFLDKYYKIIEKSKY